MTFAMGKNHCPPNLIEIGCITKLAANVSIGVLHGKLNNL
jgi:hypothetical protein